MASNTGKPNPWINFFIIIMVVAFIALCLFLPENVIRQTAELERQQMLLWGGQGATNWVGLQTADFLKDLSLEVSRITSLDINQAFKARSRHGLPVRMIQRTASTKRRLSFAVQPGSPFLPGNSCSMRAHWSSRNIVRSILTPAQKSGYDHNSSTVNNPSPCH